MPGERALLMLDLENLQRVLHNQTNFIQIRFEGSSPSSRLAHTEGHVFQRTGLNDVLSFDVTLPTLLVLQWGAISSSAHIDTVSIRVVSIPAL